MGIACERSISPISQFKVGVCVLGESGAVYLGVNIELAGASIAQAVHGEQCAVCLAVHNGEHSIRRLAVNAAPCGHCRQFLNEMAGRESLRISFQGATYSLADLLPQSFGPLELGNPFPLMAHRTQAKTLVRKAGGKAAAGGDELERLAIDAAQLSYAPYTGGLCGCAIEFDDGARFSGSYLENAAFNPALPPLQSTLVNALAGGKVRDDYARITRAVFAEVVSERPSVSHTESGTTVLHILAPAAVVDRVVLEVHP
jgi:cytidine deaminase